MLIVAKHSRNGGMRLALNIDSGRFEVAIDPTVGKPIRKRFLLLRSAKRYFARQERKLGI